MAVATTAGLDPAMIRTPGCIPSLNPAHAATTARKENNND
jgi:hypothetical protein